MHLGAVATLLLRYHNSPKIKDLLSRINNEAIVGTLVYSDPATGTVTKTCAAAKNILFSRSAERLRLRLDPMWRRTREGARRRMRISVRVIYIYIVV